MTQSISDRQQRIIIESARLFRQKGYLATTIRDIGDALGITSAALYYHFKNKDKLLQEVMLQAMHGVQNAVRDAIRDVDHPAERIRLAMRSHMLISSQYQDFAIVLLQEIRHLSPEGHAKVLAERDAYDALWDELFLAAETSNLYREGVDLHLLRLLTFGAMNLVVTWYDPTGPYRPEEIADALFKYATEGVQNPALFGTLSNQQLATSN